MQHDSNGLCFKGSVAVPRPTPTQPRPVQSRLEFELCVGSIAGGWRHELVCHSQNFVETKAQHPLLAAWPDRVLLPPRQRDQLGRAVREGYVEFDAALRELLTHLTEAIQRPE